MTMANKIVSLHELENVRSPLDSIRSQRTDGKFPGVGRLFIDVTNTEKIESEIIMTSSPFNSQFRISHVVEESEVDRFSRSINHDEENYEPTRSPKKMVSVDNWQGLGSKEKAIFKKLAENASLPKFIRTTEKPSLSTNAATGSLLDNLEEESMKSNSTITIGDDVADLETGASLAESINSLEDFSIEISSAAQTSDSNRRKNGKKLGRVIQQISSEDSAAFSVETILSCDENGNGLSSLTADSTMTEGDRLHQEALDLMQKIDALCVPSKEKSDRTILAGQRLHFDAKERAAKLEAKREEDYSLRLEAELSARSSKTISVSAVDECFDRLYNRSIDMQTAGKKRRGEIAEASRKRNEIPGPEYFGYIPLSRACDMYDKRMLAEFVRERKLSELREEKNREIEAKHEFKLAEGAFAYSVDLHNFTHRQPSSQSSYYDDLCNNSQSRSHSSDTTLKTNSLSRKVHCKRSCGTDSETDASSSSACSSACSSKEISSKNNVSLKLPLSRSDDMYKRSLRKIQARQDKISRLIKEELKEYGFKLSEGSFSSKIYQH